jgi:urease accessory protein
MNAALAERGDSPGWKADLRLSYSRSGQRTILAHRVHSGPLLVQRPFHPEGDVCHSYIIHPPGGVVGGDELKLGVHVNEGASALLTTPGATRFYRSAAGRQASLQQELVVAAGAALEWLPQETILFDGADARTCTRVTLDRDSRFIGWDIVCLGRPESGAPFTHGRAQLDLGVSIGPELTFLDRLRIASPALEPLQSSWGMRGRQALGTLLAYPGDEATVEAMRSVSSAQLACATSIVDGVVHCRAAAGQGAAIRAHFAAIWDILRLKIMRRPSLAPRVWAT